MPVHDGGFVVMNQIIMTVHTFFLIPFPGVNNGPVRQHGAAPVGNVQQIPVAFEALVVVKAGIGRLPGRLSIVFPGQKMNPHILDALIGFRKEEIEHILGATQRHQRLGFSFWDALIIETALSSGSTILYTEDLQHGQVIDGLKIVNPYVESSTSQYEFSD